MKRGMIKCTNGYHKNILREILRNACLHSDCLKEYRTRALKGVVEISSMRSLRFGMHPISRILCDFNSHSI